MYKNILMIIALTLLWGNVNASKMLLILKSNTEGVMVIQNNNSLIKEYCFVFEGKGWCLAPGNTSTMSDNKKWVITPTTVRAIDLSVPEREAKNNVIEEPQQG